MARYIDADELVRYVYEYEPDNPGKFLEAIEWQQTANVVPTRHGRWLKRAGGDCVYRCSECGQVADSYAIDVYDLLYCFHCGCEMDGVN